MDDLLTVVILVVLPVLFGPGEVDAAAAAMGLGAALAKTALFAGLMFVVGSRALPHMLIRIARFCPRELFQLAVIVVVLGTAVLAAWLFDLSFALGAFLAGVVVGGSKISHRVAAEAIPFQDLFSIIFFASVGMMVNPGLLIEHMGELALLLGLIVVGKWAINMLLGMMFRAGLESSLTIAAGLSQIGEFSFLIGQTGMALGVLSQGQYSLILGAAVFSIGLNTWMFKARTPLKRVLGGVPAIGRLYGGSESAGSGRGTARAGGRSCRPRACRGFRNWRSDVRGLGGCCRRLGRRCGRMPQLRDGVGTPARNARWRHECISPADICRFFKRAYSSISSVMGQWSLPKMSLRMPVARTRSAIESLTRK